MSSIHDDLEKTRKPRIHIKYEVETEGATVLKELPFVVGVMGDFAGDSPSQMLKPLSERKFINIDKDNFNQVMKKIGPGIQLRVENTLTDDNSEMNINLNFNAIEDFEPANLVNQIDSLKKLKDARNKLRDLLTKADRSEQLENILESTLKDPKKLTVLTQELDQMEQNSLENHHES